MSLLHHWYASEINVVSSNSNSYFLVNNIVEKCNQSEILHADPCRVCEVMG